MLAPIVATLGRGRQSGWRDLKIHRTVPDSRARIILQGKTKVLAAPEGSQSAQLHRLRPHKSIASSAHAAAGFRAQEHLLM